MNGLTVVIGASIDPGRYSNKAVRSLLHHGKDVVAVGLEEGDIEGIKILTDRPFIAGVDTVTMYVHPKRQKVLYDYILSLKPRRIIFNPGAENPELAKMAEENGIEVVEACTLVMLSIGNY